MTGKSREGIVAQSETAPASATKGGGRAQGWVTQHVDTPRWAAPTGPVRPDLIVSGTTTLSSGRGDPLPIALP